MHLYLTQSLECLECNWRVYAVFIIMSKDFNNFFSAVIDILGVWESWTVVYYVSIEDQKYIFTTILMSFCFLPLTAASVCALIEYLTALLEYLDPL